MKSKNQAATTPRSTPLESVRRRLERWRRGRKHRSPIPEALWGAAVKAAQKCGLHKTARMLRLDYYALKKRVEGAGRDGLTRPGLKPEFVELISPMPTLMPECTVELEHPRGRKMRIHLKGSAVPDLAALSRTFWSIKK